MSRRRCFSFSAMTWSRISRRQLPTQRSAIPFCQGAWMLVHFGSRLVAFRNDHIAIKFRVVVEDGIAIRASLGKGFTQLLHHPLSSRITSDVEVQNPAPAMFDYEEAIQELEGQRGHG